MAEFNYPDDVRPENYGPITQEEIEQIKKSFMKRTIAKYNKTLYPIFQPNEEAEFPTVDGGQPRIPHIIHQIFTNESVPETFKISMLSFTINNPSWEYRFWTYASGRRLLEKHHPYLLESYDSFGNDVKKADLLRFAVLYEYGGVYADLDVDNLRPLDIATKKYACIIPVEPFEHAALLTNKPFFVSTAVLLCRPKHPFFRQLLLNLQLVPEEANAVSATGPGYVTGIFMEYNNFEYSDLLYLKNIDNSTNSPYFYRGDRVDDDNDGIYVPNSQYFMDNVDRALVDVFGELRDCHDYEQLNALKKRACVEYENRKAIRARKTYTFTYHYWYHLWVQPEALIKSLKYVHIKKLIPNCTLYEDIV